MWTWEKDGGRGTVIWLPRRLKPNGAFLTAGTIAASVLVAGLWLDHAYGLSPIRTALDHANIWLLVPVILLGLGDQLVRAFRARIMLSGDRHVAMVDSYGAMVVGHGVGDFVPVVPGGPALRCVLTERLAGIPIAFSAGVYMLEGMFDSLGPALLMAYLLLALVMPGWMRWVLIVGLIQAGAMLSFPLVLGALSHRFSWRAAPGSRVAGLARAGGQLLTGLQTLTSRGLHVSASVVGLSLLITGVAALQLCLFLRAFGLDYSPGDLMLVLVLGLISGSIPVKFPGSGTIAAAAVLPIAGIHGAGLAGYVLMSRFVASSQTPAAAGLIVGWWALTRNRCFLGLGDLFHRSREQPASAVAP